jgi:hypothetical protein
MTYNSEEKKDRGPNRYPLKDHEAAKRTIARLTREVLRGDKDPEKVRAAIYCINSLIQIFKIEAPQKIETQFAGTLKCKAETEMNANELQKSIEDMEANLRRLEPDYDDFLKWQERKKRKQDIKKAQISYPDHEQISLPEPEPAEVRAMVEDAGAVWKPAGIGAR